MPCHAGTPRAIDALPISRTDAIYWDTGFPALALNFAPPKGREVLVVLYLTAPAGSKLRKYTISLSLPSGTHCGGEGICSEVGRWPGGRGAGGEAPGRGGSGRGSAGRLHRANGCPRTAPGSSRRELLRREVGKPWIGRSIHEISKRDVVEVISAIEQRGTPRRRQQDLEVDQDVPALVRGASRARPIPAEGVPLPAKEVSRQRVLNDQELAQVILAARGMDGPYGGIVEMLALTGQRREEVARMTWSELDLTQRVWTLPKSRTKNAKEHVVHLSKQSLAVLKRVDKKEPFVFSTLGTKSFQEFSRTKRSLDQLSGVTEWRLHDLRRTCVSGMARLGIAPHVADKILNHQAGTISGVAAVYQRHEFLSERREALDLWGAHIGQLLEEKSQNRRMDLKIVA